MKQTVYKLTIDTPDGVDPMDVVNDIEAPDNVNITIYDANGCLVWQAFGWEGRQV